MPQQTLKSNAELLKCPDKNKYKDAYSTNINTNEFTKKHTKA